MGQQIENALFELLLELIGGEAKLKNSMASTRQSLHGSFDSVRNATLGGITRLPERFKISQQKQERSMTMEQGVDKQALKEKCQEYLQLAKPETGDQERAYITGKMNEMTDTIARETAKCDLTERNTVMKNAFQKELGRYSEEYRLMEAYKKGGDRALTAACNFNTDKKKQFYERLPGGEAIYEQIKQYKMENKDITGLEVEAKRIIEQSLSSNKAGETRNQTVSPQANLLPEDRARSPMKR